MKNYIVFHVIKIQQMQYTKHCRITALTIKIKEMRGKIPTDYRKWNFLFDIALCPKYISIQ